MKQLFASCAVIALMAAPALAQSTVQPAYPPAETDVMKDEPVAEAPGAVMDANPEEAVQPAAKPEQSAEAEIDPPPQLQTAMAETADTFEAPINVDALPQDYSTADLNALMLAQLSQPVMTVAEASVSAGTAESASAQTGGPVAPEAESYASADSGAATAEAGDPASSAGDTASVPEEADESVRTAETPDASPTTAEGDTDQTAIEVAARDERLSTLVELVGISGLESAFNQEGPFTVFAPTNEAFAALPAATVEHLKSETGKAELVEILKAHVIQGVVMADDVPATGKQVMSAAKQPLNLTSRADGTFTVEGINTIGDGLYASNGVVYAIDAVILPEAAATGTPD